MRNPCSSSQLPAGPVARRAAWCAAQHYLRSEKNSELNVLPTVMCLTLWLFIT